MTAVDVAVLLALPHIIGAIFWPAAAAIGELAWRLLRPAPAGSTED